MKNKKLYLNFLLIFLVSFSISACKFFQEEYSIENNSSEIISLSLSNEENVKILPNLCFKFIEGDFPMILNFDNYGSNIPINDPTNYEINASGELVKRSKKCTTNNKALL